MKELLEILKNDIRNEEVCLARLQIEVVIKQSTITELREKYKELDKND